MKPLATSGLATNKKPTQLREPPQLATQTDRVSCERGRVGRFWSDHPFRDAYSESSSLYLRVWEYTYSRWQKEIRTLRLMKLICNFGFCYFQFLLRNQTKNIIDIEFQWFLNFNFKIFWFFVFLSDNFPLYNYLFFHLFIVLSISFVFFIT